MMNLPDLKPVPDSITLDMLMKCGIPVAMGNAFPEVKEACKYSTTDNEDDGKTVVLERIFS